MNLTAPKPFLKAGVAAFPRSCRARATALVELLLPAINDDYRRGSKEIFIGNEIVSPPTRLHFTQPNTVINNLPVDLRLMAHCLYTRSTDGYLRHSSLKQILVSDEAWCIPYIALLSGEYVVEITQDIQSALPKLNRAAYVQFVQENRPVMRWLRARATSYWHAYYDHIYKDKASYPGLRVLNELDHWAS